MALKYELKYDDIVGVEHHFELFDDNYTGSPIEVYGRITLDYGQVKENLEAIRGQGLRVDLEADVDLTFEELFEENEKTFLCTYKRDSQILFRGWLNPEGFFEDYVNDKWQVSFDCIDGLGYLKELSFVDSNGFNIVGIKSQLEILSIALQRTGIQENINVAINIFYDTLADTESILENVFVECSRYVKDDGTTISSCEEVVKDVLEPYGAVLVSNKGEWTIYKPNELFNDSTITFFKYDYLGASLGSETIDFDFTIGSQLDEFYPHHANANQRFTNIPSVGAYRINYKFGELRQYIINRNLYSNNGVIDSWTISNYASSNNLVNLSEDGYGVVLNSINFGVPASDTVMFFSDRVPVKEGVFFTYNIKGEVIGNDVNNQDPLDVPLGFLGFTQLGIRLDEIVDGSVVNTFAYAPNPNGTGGSWLNIGGQIGGVISLQDSLGNFSYSYFNYLYQDESDSDIMGNPTPFEGEIYCYLKAPLENNSFRRKFGLASFDFTNGDAGDPRIDDSSIGQKVSVKSEWLRIGGGQSDGNFNTLTFDIDPANNSIVYDITIKDVSRNHTYLSQTNLTSTQSFSVTETRFVNPGTLVPVDQFTVFEIDIFFNGDADFNVENLKISKEYNISVFPTPNPQEFFFADKFFTVDNPYQVKINSFDLILDDRSNENEKGTVSTFERTEKPSARTLPTKKVVTGDDTKNIFSGGLLKSDKKTITKEWYRKENVYQATTNYYVKPNTTAPNYGTTNFLYYFPDVDLTGATTITDENGKTRPVASLNYFTNINIGSFFPPFVGVPFTGTRIESNNFVENNVIEDDLVSFIKTFSILIPGEVNKPILEIMGSETMRMTAKTMRIFSGDVFGYFDYLSRVNIDQRAGKYGVTKYSYDTYNNVISMEIKQMYGTVLNDLSVETVIETDNVVEPTIRG